MTTGEPETVVNYYLHPAFCSHERVGGRGDDGTECPDCRFLFLDDDPDQSPY